MIRLMGLLSVLLTIAPLIGLATLIVFPPQDPFGGEPPSLGLLFVQTGLTKLFVNSMLVSLLSAIFATLVGGWLAWVEHRSTYVGKKGLIALSLILLATPSYILAATLASRINIIASPYFRFEGLFASIVCLTLVCVPYGQLTISSALARVSGSEEQAAKVLGASSFLAFKVAIWPQIKDAVVLAFFISFLYALSDFGAVATLDAPVLTWRLYEAIRAQDLARASILGLASLIATIPIFVLVNWLRGTPNRTANPVQPFTTVLRGFPAFGTYLIHTVLIVLGLILPVFELFVWIWDGWSRQLTFVSQWDATFATLLLSALGALLTLIMVMSPAWLYVQRSSVYKSAVYLSSALPGVLLAFGLMVTCLFITKYTGGYAMVLGSGALLFVGYSMRFMSEAFGPVASSMTQLNPRLAETAKVLDRFPTDWIKKVFVPYMTPSVLRAFLLVFLACMKELPITLLLGGATGFRTLAFRTWDRYNEALWHDAGFSGLILLLTAFVITTVTLRWKTNA